MNKGWQAVPVPARMGKLQRDHRGYPVPVVVYRDKEGRPHFTINDTARAITASATNRCQICGQDLDRFKWLIGGPRSAFHDHGAYFDGPMHKECATYALTVCPWLALTRYRRAVEDRTLSPEAKHDAMILVDQTQDPDRPELFILSATTNAKLVEGSAGLGYVHQPVRPWRRVEYWQHGQQLTGDAGRTLLRQHYSPEDLKHMPERD